MHMSGALRYYTGLTPVRWDWIQPEQVPLLRESARARGYPGSPFSFLLRTRSSKGAFPGNGPGRNPQERDSVAGRTRP